MFLDRSALHTALFGNVGFHQTTNPEYPNLAASLLVSRENRFIQDEHPLIQIENIDQTLKNFDHYSYTAYSAMTTYSLYSKVSHGGVNYEYINATASAGNTPPNATYWAVIDSLSDYLIKLSYKAIDNTLDAVFNHKKIKGQVKSIFNNVRLFRGPARVTDTITNEGKMVGLMVKMKDQRSLVTILNSIGHQFDGAIADLPIKIYQSSQQAAIASKTISHTTAKSFQWTAQTADNILRAYSDDYDIDGFFLISYKQDDLDAVKAIRKDIVWNYYESCCDVKDKYKQYSPFVKATGFYFNAADLDGDNLPDIENIVIDHNSNYGLNLELTTQCDLSAFIIQQQSLLAEAQSLNMARLLLENMAYSTRKNLSAAVREQAKKELFSFKDTWGTLTDRLKKASAGLNFDLSGLDEACLPCSDTMVDIDSP